MGANAITTITIGSCLLISCFYYAPDAYEKLHYALTTFGLSDEYAKSLLNAVKLSSKESQELRTKSENLLTPEELKKFDGGPDSKGLYLAVLGEIFDVGKGAQHYKPGGGYSFFAGRDATRAYITGDFDENGLVDDVSGLDAEALLGIEDWLSFYKEEYTPVGKVIGRYYDSIGNPTGALQEIKERIAKGKQNKWLEDKEKEVFPPCNSEWSHEKGSRVWCTQKSGGVERTWVGVPRQYHKKGKDPRCVCVRNQGPPSPHPDATDHPNRGDLDHPDLTEYPNCPADSVSCKVDHP